MVYDEKKDRLKVSAKEVLNRKDLQTFHDDLNKHLKEKLPFYEKGILNDQTLPFQNVEEIKIQRNISRNETSIRAKKQSSE